MEEASERIMDAMILLDPPHLSKGTSKLAAPDIAKAHEILLSTASIPFDHDANDMIANQDSVAVLSDLYRAIILSSYLLLEICPWEDAETHEHDVGSSLLPLASLSKAQVQILHETITKSILLLQRLGHFKYLANGVSFHDWHDDLLPKSHHPLLQECFQRKPMVDTEVNVVFGMEQRLVSLEIDDYVLQEGWFSTSDDDPVHHHPSREHHRKDNWARDHELEESSFVLPHEHNHNSQYGPPSRVNQEEMEGIELSFHPKDLAREETELLNIALPDQQQAHRKEKKRKLDDSLANVACRKPSSELIANLEEHNLLQYMRVPFYINCCIQKEGRLVMQTPTACGNEGVCDTPCHIILFSNGSLYIQWQETNTDNGPNTSFILYRLSENTECHPRSHNSTFHFMIDHLTCVSSNHSPEESIPDENTLLVAVDVDEGGSLMEGYRWMTEIADCAKFIRCINETRTCILENKWSAGVAMEEIPCIDDN